MMALHDYYLILLETSHGKRYWIIADDDIKIDDRVHSIRIDGKNVEEVEEVARCNFPLDLWDNGKVEIEDFVL